jgi:hypothetical protein
VPAETRAQFEALCQHFAKSYSSEVLGLVDAFEAAARQTQLTSDQLQELVATARYEGPAGNGATVQRVLRPLFLEILLRLFGADHP